MLNQYTHMAMVSGQQMATQEAAWWRWRCAWNFNSPLGLVTAQTNHHHQRRGADTGAGKLGQRPSVHLLLDTYGQPEVQRKYFMSK